MAFNSGPTPSFWGNFKCFLTTADLLTQSKTCNYLQGADLNYEYRVMNSWQRHKAKFAQNGDDITPNEYDVIWYSTRVPSNWPPSQHGNIKQFFLSLAFTPTYVLSCQCNRICGIHWTCMNENLSVNVIASPFFCYPNRVNSSQHFLVRAIEPQWLSNLSYCISVTLTHTHTRSIWSAHRAA